MSGKRVLVCGGRHYPDGVMVFRVLTFLANKWGKPSLIIHGDAGIEDKESGIPYEGADKFGGFWAVMSGIPVLVYPYLKNFGKAGGPIRNAQMIKEGKPDVVIAFYGGKGTANMIIQAKVNGVPVIEIKNGY
jgi:hypothetical protein